MYCPAEPERTKIGSGCCVGWQRGWRTDQPLPSWTMHKSAPPLWDWASTCLAGFRPWTWSRLLCSPDPVHGEPSNTTGAPRPTTTGPQPDSSRFRPACWCKLCRGAVVSSHQQVCPVSERCWRTKNTAWISRRFMCRDSSQKEENWSNTVSASCPSTPSTCKHGTIPH